MSRHNHSFFISMMYYDYLICGLRVRFAVPWLLTVTEESRPFLTESEGEPHLTVRFSAVDALELPENGGIWRINSCFQTQDGVLRVWHCPVRGEMPYCCVVWDPAHPEVVRCTYLRGQEEQIAYTKNLLMLLGLESFLLQFDGLLLHASLVDWQGRGILFCAPSGTGKSTQARLWEQCMGSRTLNGDRAGIRCAEGQWRAWGLPYAGSSGIYCNESVPIRAIVLLRQGEENRLTPAPGMEAFRRLLPECNARRWDAGFMERLMGLLSDLVREVPMYQLECRPEPQAVALLRDELLKEG